MYTLPRDKFALGNESVEHLLVWCDNETSGYVIHGTARCPLLLFTTISETSQRCMLL